MAEKVFYLKDAGKVADSEKLTRHGYYIEAAKNFGEDKEGYYIYVKAGEDFFEEIEVLKDAEELEGEKAEEIRKEFKEREDQVASGFSLF